MTTTLLLNRCHYPVTALGPGVRAGIWVQGCTIACPGCVAVDTWAATPEAAVGVDAVMGWLSTLDGPVDGVTISGGEPFQQPQAVGALIREIRDWAGPGRLDVLVYSGYSLSRLRSRTHLSALVDLCDAVVTGPYVRARPDGGWLRGSSNQVLTPLTALGRERYGAESVEATRSGEPEAPLKAPRMQVSVEGGRVRMIGVPRRGDLDRAAEELRRAGIEIEGASWWS
ncbi:4Fe-4S single cluster domain-containing protein [Sphaerisporangium sp. TRM90804]|uniref:4Fe-4S single cluster domain-containing protein n=1 Tax=Sphaerisporangium sp. TRM90804 TaxID=3031113 RepID=UPI00244CBC22|nr:4Fe-4S single cluster domain-containing protein [Sphaerisporangium sp. TRM90804]MDH2425659.1 4Fe-4S single cluster domain-containing protein [Sphaerisporangium sp. TRM90804]